MQKRGAFGSVARTSDETLSNLLAVGRQETRGAIAGLQPASSAHSANLAQCRINKIM